MNPIPKWIVGVCCFMSLLGLFVGGSLYLAPGQFIPGVDFSSPGIQFLAQMWAARQVAIAAAIGFSTLRKSVPMLQISLGIYCVMNIQDMLIGVAQHDFGLTVGATFFGGLAALMIVILRKRNPLP